MSVSPVEGTLVTDQVEPTKACAVGRVLTSDAIRAKELESFIAGSWFDYEVRLGVDPCSIPRSPLAFMENMK